MLANCVRESRIQHLNVMHQMILETKNSDIFADWILLLHDEQSENIAESDGFYSECCDLFEELIADESY
jgi:hypothetical protein